MCQDLFAWVASSLHDLIMQMCLIMLDCNTQDVCCDKMLIVIGQTWQLFQAMTVVKYIIPLGKINPVRRNALLHIFSLLLAETSPALFAIAIDVV